MSLTGAASGASGAVSSIFSGFASEKKSEMYHIEAEADLLKGKGAELEGQSYGRARELALLNKNFAEESLGVQQAQADRSIYMGLGGVKAAVGASGLQQSGSALDVLSASAQQGALEKEVLAKQGLITEAGYQEQADVYGNMVKASDIAVQASHLANQMHLKAADAEDTAATGHFITAAIQGVTAVANLFTGGILSGGGGGGGDSGGGAEAIAAAVAG